MQRKLAGIVDGARAGNDLCELGAMRRIRQRAAQFKRQSFGRDARGLRERCIDAGHRVRGTTDQLEAHEATPQGVPVAIHVEVQHAGRHGGAAFESGQVDSGVPDALQQRGIEGRRPRRCITVHAVLLPATTAPCGAPIRRCR